MTLRRGALICLTLQFGVLAGKAVAQEAAPTVIRAPSAEERAVALAERYIPLVATALWVDEGTAKDGSRWRHVVLIPEATWKGPLTDTISVESGATSSWSCRSMFAGARYLVYVDRAPSALSAACVGATLLPDGTVGAAMAGLGRPTWEAYGPEDLEVLGMVSPLDTVPTSEDLVAVLLLFPGGVDRVTLAGRTWTLSGNSRELHLPPGIYAGHVVWKSGWESTLYLGVRCDEGSDRCSSYRHLFGLDVPISLKGQVNGRRTGVTGTGSGRSGGDTRARLTTSIWTPLRVVARVSIG